MSFKKQNEWTLEIPADCDTEEGTKERTLWKRRRLFGVKNASTPNVAPEIVKDAYMDSKIFDSRFYQNVLLNLINRHASYTLKYIVYACIDPNKWEQIQAETTLAANSSVLFQCSDAWTAYKISVCNSVGGNAATVEGYGSGRS